MPPRHVSRCFSRSLSWDSLLALVAGYALTLQAATLECGMPRYPGLTLRVLAGDFPAIGPGKARLITLIDATGSISAAAREMEMSYRRAWAVLGGVHAGFAGALLH